MPLKSRSKSTLVEAKKAKWPSLVCRIRRSARAKQLPAFRFAAPLAKRFAFSVELPDSSNRTFLPESPGNATSIYCGPTISGCVPSAKETVELAPIA
jgi:hypothetical protein